MLARYLLCLDYSKQSNNHKTSKDEAKTLIPFILMFVATFSVKEWWLLGLHPTSPDLVLAWHALGSSGQDPSSFLPCLCLTFADMWRGVHCMRAVWGIFTRPLRVQMPQMTRKRWAKYVSRLSYKKTFKCVTVQTPSVMVYSTYMCPHWYSTITSWKTVGWGCQGSLEGDRIFPSMLRCEFPYEFWRGVYYSLKIQILTILLSSNLFICMIWGEYLSQNIIDDSNLILN